MNVGLKGDIFVQDFSHLGELAEDCWFKKTWESCHRFKAALIIHEFHDVPKTRRRDKALMECFINCGVYNINELSILNMVYKYKKAHSLADILQYDGKTFNLEIILTQQTDIVSTQ